MSIKSQREYLFKKSALQYLTDEMYEDMENFSESEKEKAEYSYPNDITLILLRVESNGMKATLIKDNKEMNIVK